MNNQPKQISLDSAPALLARAKADTTVDSVYRAYQPLAWADPLWREDFLISRAISLHIKSEGYNEV